LSILKFFRVSWGHLLPSLVQALPWGRDCCGRLFSSYSFISWIDNTLSIEKRPGLLDGYVDFFKK